MSVLLIAASPTQPSRSAALLDAVGQRLQARGAHTELLSLRELEPRALLLADTRHPNIAQAVAQVASAQVVVVATPVYKAAYSGLLKVFLDLLAQTALQGKTVLPLATGGSPHHMLALDYALRPVLQSLGAKHILPGIYASDAQITSTAQGSYTIGTDIAARLDDAVHTLVTEALRPRTAPAAAFAPVPFAQVRCSV
jgi:FMN reductase